MRLIRTLACCLLASAGPAVAITYDFTATVSYVADDSGYLSGTGIAANTSTVSGTFTYDPSSGDDLPENGTEYYFGVASNFSATLDGTFDLTMSNPVGNRMTVINNSAPYNDFAMVRATQSGASYPTFDSFDLPLGSQTSLMQFSVYNWLSDPNQSVFSNTSLPTMLTLDDFANALLQVNVRYNDSTFYLIHAEVDTLAAVVPLPAAAWLFLSGLVALFGFRRLQLNRSVFQHRRPHTSRP